MIPQLDLPAPFARQLRTARQLVEDRRRTQEERWLPTACPGLDRLLAGGLRRGTMVELIGGRSSGRFSLVLTALAATTGRGEAAALVDLGDGFDPRAAAAAGVELERLLWARPRHVKEVLACAEAILQCGMPLVVVDLGMPPLPGGRGVEAAWLRLARSARAHRSALLVASPYRASGTAAQAVLEARPLQARWRGSGMAPRLLGGISARLDLVKSRGARPGGPREGDAEGLRLRSAAEIGGEPWGGDGEQGGVVVAMPGRADREEVRRAIA